jgi:hypothetical protein
LILLAAAPKSERRRICEQSPRPWLRVALPHLPPRKEEKDPRTGQNQSETDPDRPLLAYTSGISAETRHVSRLGGTHENDVQSTQGRAQPWKLELSLSIARKPQDDNCYGIGVHVANKWTTE